MARYRFRPQAALVTLFIALVLVTPAIRAAKQAEVPLTLDRLTLKGVVADRAKHQNREALRLLEADKSRKHAWDCDHQRLEISRWHD